MSELVPVEYLVTDSNFKKDDFRPDWSLPCENCGATPVVPLSGLCGPCHFGEADTVQGGWWDEQKDEMK